VQVIVVCVRGGVRLKQNEAGEREVAGVTLRESDIGLRSFVCPLKAEQVTVETGCEAKAFCCCLRRDKSAQVVRGGRKAERSDRKSEKSHAAGRYEHGPA
jgi:hypothetical protein